jgi:hypothetical protein
MLSAHPQRRLTFAVVSLALLLSTLQGIPAAHASVGPKGSLQFLGSLATPKQVVARLMTAPGTGEFTYETWVKTTLDQSVTSDANIIQAFISTRSLGYDANTSIEMRIGGVGDNGAIRVGVNNSSSAGFGRSLTTGTGQIVANRWYHVAFVRALVGATYVTSLYLDGVLKDSSSAITDNLLSPTTYLGSRGDHYQGTGGDASKYDELRGSISNIRISNYAEYRGAFTPATGPLVATLQTQLLLNTTNDANYVTNTGTKTGVTIDIQTYSNPNRNTINYPVSSSDSPFANPTLSSLSVNTGALAGGTLTELIGTNLSSTTGIIVGGASATGVTVNSSTSVSFTTPSGTSGAKDVVVSTMLGAFTLTGGYTYANIQTITFSALTDKIISDTPPALSATATSGLTVAFTSATTGVCTVSGTSVTFVGPGTCTINANQAGNGTYAAAPQVQRSFAIAYLTQTISFDALTGATLGVSSAPLIKASASSGLGVSFSSATPGVCAVSGSIISMLNPGTCTITASQAGNGTYSAAASVNQSFTITAKPDDGQKELMEILALLPGLASISKNIGDLAVNNMTKCVKGKLVKRVKIGAKCPKGYVKRK